MKALNFQVIDGYEIVTLISRPEIDPQETQKRVEMLLVEHPELTKTESELYSEYAVHAHGIANQRLVEDTVGDDFEASLSTLDEHEKLLSSGEKIADWRNTEFWIKDQVWKKQKIECLGETIPADGILEKDLNASQRTKIGEEGEHRRILALTPEHRAKEKNDRLNAAKREATLLKSDAEIAGEDFNAPAWFQAKKAEIEAKYGA
jgi:hypothetical protein